LLEVRSTLQGSLDLGGNKRSCSLSGLSISKSKLKVYVVIATSFNSNSRFWSGTWHNSYSFSCNAWFEASVFTPGSNFCLWEDPAELRPYEDDQPV